MTIDSEFLAIKSSWKQPISKALSFPIKTRELDRSLAGLPMAGEILVTFSSGYKLAKRWEESGKYPLVEANYGRSPRQTTHSWSIYVLPLPRTLRHEACTLLVTSGLPILRSWFIATAELTGMEGGTSLVLSFQPGDDSISQEQHGNLSPRVGHA